MTYSKYCNICDTFVTCSFRPNWCPWCGKDLRSEPIVGFSGIEGLLAKLNEMRGFPDPPDKVPWDGYYAHNTGRHLLLRKNINREPIIDQHGQVKLF